jgi:glycerophosphoryl diester phosphodiesterase
MNEPLPRGITRRTTLGWLGALAVGTTAAGCRGADPGSAPLVGDYRLADWVAERGERYLIGHRGAGDVLPEHSMASYQAAADWGAKAMEISVGITSDGVLVCLHDLTLERTTNLAGPLRGVSAAALAKGWIDIPRLGPYWKARARVPLFEDVLRRFGGRVILCVEAKDQLAYAPMMAMVRRYGLESSIMLKTYFKSKRIAAVKSLGIGVFAYFTTPAETTPEALQVLAAQLSPGSDAIVVPNSGPGGYLADDLVDAAVATGIPVWPYPLHRRSDVTHYAAFGVAGAVTSNIGYLGGRTVAAASDQWAGGAAVPGELTRDPYDDRFAPVWGPQGTIKLAARKVQHFLTLGNLCPITSPAYQVEFEAAYDELASGLDGNLTLAFGHQDDRYYEHRLGLQDGYHAILQADGGLGLYTHHAGQAAGVKLGTAATVPPARGKWMRFRLEVTPQQLIWSRLDVPGRVTAVEKSYRGGYLHLGRASADGILSLRNLKVTRAG